jgi:hypothetical protein
MKKGWPRIRCPSRSARPTPLRPVYQEILMAAETSLEYLL